MAGTSMDCETPKVSAAWTDSCKRAIIPEVSFSDNCSLRFS